MPVHINAKPKDVAPLVLITGDPTRAIYMATHFLEKVKQYSEVRMEPGFTGYYKGKRVSIQSAGIGMPSLKNYIKELAEQLGVKRIIRMGTCGSFKKYMRVGDLVIAQGGCSDSGMNPHRFGFLQFAPIPDYGLMSDACRLAKRMGMSPHVGNILGTDNFYPDTMPKGWKKPPEWKLWEHYGVLGVDMETPKLYTLGQELKFDALSILVVSDNLARKEKALSSKQRTEVPAEVVKLALEIL